MLLKFLTESEANTVQEFSVPHLQFDKRCHSLTTTFIVILNPYKQVEHKGWWALKGGCQL